MISECQLKAKNGLPTFKSCQLAEMGSPLMTALYLDLAHTLYQVSAIADEQAHGIKQAHRQDLVFTLPANSGITQHVRITDGGCRAAE